MIILLMTITLFFGACDETGKKRAGTESIHVNTQVVGDTVRQPGKNIMVVFQDSKNVYWFGSWETGIYKFDGKTIINYTTKHGLPDNRVEEIKEDKSGNIYFNTTKGLCQFDGNTFVELTETMIPESDWRLNPDDLWFKDLERSEYVYRFDGNHLHRMKFPKSALGEDYIQKHPTNPRPYTIYCIYKDSKNNVWFGTSTLGVCRYNGKSFDWISEPDLTEMHDGPANGVRSIAEDKNGEFWFNTEYRYRVYNKTSSTDGDINSTKFYDRVKSIGCLDGKKDGDLNEYLSIVKDDSNDLWIAIYLHGVWKYDGKKITHFPIQDQGKNVPVFCLYKDHNDDIWLGTHENGVFKFNGQTFVKFKL